MDNKDTFQLEKQFIPVEFMSGEALDRALKERVLEIGHSNPVIEMMNSPVAKFAQQNPLTGVNSAV